MARRHRKSSHSHSERWLVSYADLLTLLFAFFVVMFASSQTNRHRNREISEAVEKAFQSNGLASKAKPQASSPPAPKPSPAKPSDNPVTRSDLAAAMEALRSTLGGEMSHGQVAIHLEPRGAIISLNAQAVFPLGGDAVDAAMFPLLAKIALTLNRLPNPIRLEGHTDSLPISNGRFRSNWELSAARSIAVLRVLNERYSIDRKRMTIAGYADTNPVADNTTETGRIKNRRVDLVILDRVD